MLSDQLRKCRQRCGLAQRQVAEQIGVDRSTYTYYELGTTSPSIETIKRLATIYGVSIDWLLEYTPPESNKRR